MILRDGVEELRAPKYASIERERRFLVDTARRPDLSALGFVLIEDLYIEDTRLRLRRMQDSASGHCTHKLTKKYGTHDPLARLIVTAYLTDEEYRAMAILPGRLLSKRRYPVRGPREEFGLDVFLGPLSGLELAEVECASDEALREAQVPDWVLREVSSDPDFEGGNLACLDAQMLAALLRKGAGPTAPGACHGGRKA